MVATDMKTKNDSAKAGCHVCSKSTPVDSLSEVDGPVLFEGELIDSFTSLQVCPDCYSRYGSMKEKGK